MVYIDYGNQEEIPLSLIQPLPSQFCNLPAQALSCHLNMLDLSSHSSGEMAAFLHKWLSMVLTGGHIHILVESAGLSNDVRIEAFIPSTVLCSEESVSLLQQLLGDPPASCLPVGVPSSISLTSFLNTLLDHYDSLSSGSPSSSCVRSSLSPAPPPPPAPCSPSPRPVTTSHQDSHSPLSISSSHPPAQVPFPNEPEDPLPSHMKSSGHAEQSEGAPPGLSLDVSTPSKFTEPASNHLSNVKDHFGTNRAADACKSPSPGTPSMGEHPGCIKHLPLDVDGGAAVNNVCGESSSAEVDIRTARPLDLVDNVPPSLCHATPTIADLRLPDLRLKVSDQFSLLVSHTISPSCFYVHPVLQEAHDLLQLETSLKEHYLDPCRCVPLPDDSIHPGALCCIQSGDDHLWYRAVVCESSPDDISSGDAGKQVYVMFVDYGFTQSVPTTSLVLLDSSFTTTAIQCICCSLDGIRPAVSAKSIKVSYTLPAKEPSKQEQGKDKYDHLSGSHLEAAERAKCEVQVTGTTEPSTVTPSNKPAISSPNHPLSSPLTNASSSPKGYPRRGHVPTSLPLSGEWDKAAIQLLVSLTEEKQLVGTVCQCFGKCTYI